MLPSSPLFAVVLAVVPAVLRWWWGRRLARYADDPALAERLAAHHKRNGIVLVVAVATLIARYSATLLWTLPLLVLTRAVAGYSLRKRLYGETWSVAGYLSFFGRLVVSIYGFWILLLNASFIEEWCAPLDWLAAIALGVLLVTWNEWGIDAIRWMLRARPLTEPALAARFEELARRANLPPEGGSHETTHGVELPRFEYVDLGGGAVANAVALPSLKRSGVLFSSTLLSLLDADEIIAISAHEIAHLEYYDRKRLRRARVVNLGLIALAILSEPIARRAMPMAASWTSLLLLVAVAVALLARAKDRQKNETASDLRAVALCGDAEALARGLTKLYTFARVPRRWDVQRERQATHPSLARRIRDIRAAAGIVPAPLAAPAAFAAANGPASVAFGDGRLEWRESEGVTHTLSYAHLSELRVQARTSGPARLVAVERGGRKWEMVLGPDDVAPVQTVLDAVDGRLAPVTTPAIGPSLVRVVTLLGVTLSALFGQIACAVVALLAVMFPDSRLLVGAGVAAMTSAALILREWFLHPHAMRITMAATLAGIAGAVLLLAQWSRRDETASPALKPIAALGGAAAVMLAVLAAGGLHPIRIHQSARALPAAAVFLLALAGALAIDRRRALRLTAIAPALLGAAVIFAGSLVFLDWIGRDPLLVVAGPATIRTFDAVPSTEFPVTFSPGTLRLSPGGRAVIVAPGDDRDYEAGTRTTPEFHVGRTDGVLKPLAADDLVFADDEHALALMLNGGAGEVREFAIADPSATIWRERVTGITSGTLCFDSASGEWHVLGWTPARRIIRAVGHVGRTGATLTEWTVPSSRHGWVSAMTATGSIALLLDTVYEPGPFSSPLLSAWYAVLRSHTGSRLWRVGAGEGTITAESRLEVSCADGEADGDRLVCAAFDGARTRLVTVDPQSARITPLSTLWGRFRTYGTAAPGWVTGWLNSTPSAVRLATNEALQIPPRPHEWITAIAATNDAIGTISSSGDTWIVRVYRLAERSAKR